MSLRLPAPAWHRLQTFLAAHPTCQVRLHFHEGRVCKVEMQESFKVSEEAYRQLPLDNFVSVETQSDNVVSSYLTGLP